MAVTLIYSNRHLSGEYTETCIDLRKKTTNRLISICGKYYTVITIQGQILEFVGKRAFDKWAKTNDYCTDF